MANRSKTAFTLVELLVVIGIVAILTALAVPAFRSIGGAQQLSTGTDLIAGHFDLARQTALAENMRIELRFWKIPDASGAGFRWRAVQLYRVSTDQPIGKMARLPEGVTMLESDKFSTLLGSANSVGKGDVAGMSQLDYKAVRFSPEGSADLNPGGPPSGSNSWTVTLVPANTKSTATRPADNFATVQLDPVTGRAKVYRP